MVEQPAVRTEAGAKILAMTTPRVPERENAALVYQQAFDALTPREQLKSPWKEKTGAWLDGDGKFDRDDKDLQEFLHAQERGLALLRQAAALPECWFEHDYFQMYDMLLPEIMQLRYGAELLALDARTRVAHGEHRAAVDDVTAIFRIARHTNDPILISLLVAARIDRTATSALEDVLAVPLKPEELARLTLPRNVSFRKGLERCFQMEEVAGGLAMFGTLSNASPTEPGLSWLRSETGNFGMGIFRSAFYRVFFLPDDLAAYRRIMRQCQALAGRPYAETADEWEKFMQSVQVHQGGIVTRLITPAFNRCAAVAAETDAGHHLAELALAVAAYQAKHGKYPETINDLLPAFLDTAPLDPFDGKPLRLKHEGKALVLYSIGKDRKDDGGIPFDTSTQQGDILFRLPGR